jgi:hypothetical protein
MFDIGFKAGEIVKHDEVCKRAGCGCIVSLKFALVDNLDAVTDSGVIVS